MTALLASPLRNLAGGLAFILCVAVLATTAYMECGWSAGDAAYMVVMTIHTVGYGEVRPVDTPELRAITIGLIIAGCTGMIFMTSALVQLITASQLQHILGTRRMHKDIAALADHIIVCGFGRIGQMLAREQGFLALQADATDEDARARPASSAPGHWPPCCLTMRPMCSSPSRRAA